MNEQLPDSTYWCYYGVLPCLSQDTSTSIHSPLGVIDDCCTNLATDTPIWSSTCFRCCVWPGKNSNIISEKELFRSLFYKCKLHLTIQHLAFTVKSVCKTIQQAIKYNNKLCSLYKLFHYFRVTQSWYTSSLLKQTAYLTVHYALSIKQHKLSLCVAANRHKPYIKRLQQTKLVYRHATENNIKYH